MITALKNKIIESDKPVGVKTTNNWKLPPSEFAYGKKEKDDEFHAGASKYIIKLIYNSNWKLGRSSAIKA